MFQVRKTGSPEVRKKNSSFLKNLNSVKSLPSDVLTFRLSVYFFNHNTTAAVTSILISASGINLFHPRFIN